MSWMKVTLSTAESAKGTLGQIQTEFAEIFMRAGAPPAAAMYAGKDFARDTVAYFTPHAVALAPGLLRKYRAESCPEPDKETLAVLVQNSGSQAHS